MPPKAATGDAGKTDDQIIIIALLMAMKEHGVGVKKASHEVMSKLHGNRSVDGFSWALRAPTKLANELLEKVKSGQELTPADVGKVANGDGATANTPKKRGAPASGEDGGSAKKKRTPAKKTAKKVDSGAEDEGVRSEGSSKIKGEDVDV